MAEHRMAEHRMTDMSDLELLDALGVEAKEEKKKKRTPKEERIIAGFEEIQKFVETNERLPAVRGHSNRDNWTP